VLIPAERVGLIIADISGYTGYLTGSELAHARDVMADLLETVLEAMGPAPRLSALEGDAVFLTVPEADLDGSMLLDTLEGCYFAFRRRIRSIARATTCPCNACKGIRGLDLKFCVHHGEVVRQRIVGQEKLMGGDVILVHRLLKNTVTEILGLQGYALFTATCLERLHLDPVSLAMIPHQEQYEHFGPVALYVHDLNGRWRRQEQTQRVPGRPEEADLAMEVLLPAPLQMVWEYLTSPAKRWLWVVGVTAAHQEPVEQRRGVGTVIHCVHGEHSHPEQILDWHPFQGFTWVTPLPGFGVTTIDFDLLPVESGTNLQLCLRLAAPIPEDQRATADQVLGEVRASFETLTQILGQEMSGREDAVNSILETRTRLRETATRSSAERSRNL
jgi:uncharacterized protein YndB with AHSA1/START domain